MAGGYCSVRLGGPVLAGNVDPQPGYGSLYVIDGARNGYNQLVVRPLYDETTRDIVRPSPDLFYASCIYNLNDGPLLIEAQIPDRFWSMQFYQMNTDNFAGISNQRDQRHRIGTVAKVTLISVGDDPANYKGDVIQSPTDRGIVLLRASAIGDRSPQLAALEASGCRSGDK